MRKWANRCGVVLLGCALAIAGCNRGGTEPGEIRYHVRVHGGDLQFGVLSTNLADPLEVVVTQEGTERAVGGVTVRWSVVEGEGAALLGAVTETDYDGVASTRLRLGDTPGVVRVQATVDQIAGRPAEFVVHAIERPRILSVSTEDAAVGDTIVVRGEHFAAEVEGAAVSFDGIHGMVISATPTEIRVEVPRCVPSRRVDVVVLAYTVPSEAVRITVTGDDGPLQAIAPGEVLELRGADASRCLRLGGDGAQDRAYLLVANNVAKSPRTRLPFQLIGLVDQPPPQPPTMLAGLAEGVADFPLRWEARLRENETRLPPSTLTAPRRAFGAAEVPKKGDSRRFKVYNREAKFSDVTAVVRYVGEHVVLYEDENAPTGGFGDADYAEFGRFFDGTIFETVSDVFGAPSDLDGNGRVIVLFTPVVNELTPRGSGSFVAGYFYACDLRSRKECSGSNEGEVFYSVVPDPDGRFGDRRMRAEVKDAVLPVLAHELQHMIHFNERVLLRGGRQETSWLSEGLAHAAENVVANRLTTDPTMAAIFRKQNISRARRYLYVPDLTTFIGEASPGTIEERGAQWLFVEYLAGHFGGDAFLGRLTRDTLDAIANIEDKTGVGWGDLIGRFAVALFADDAPWFANTPVDAVYTFPHIDLRSLMGGTVGGYPLVPTDPWNGGAFRVGGTLYGSSTAYFLLTVGGSRPDPLHVRFTGREGTPFEDEDPARLSVLRLY